LLLPDFARPPSGREVMASPEQLDAYLRTNSYLGSVTCATLEDYKVCKQLSNVDAKRFPSLSRWHSHVSYLLSKYPKVDYRFEAVPAGKGISLGNGPRAEETPKKEAAPKKQAAPKKETAPKKTAKAEKEPAPKAEPKKEGKKDAKKGAKEPEEPAEPTPEEKAKARKDLLKKVIKEGGKRGVEIEGAADMGGLQFFCTSLELPDGDIELLVDSMKAMNAEPDPEAEERKGCSGHIGKMIFSAGAEQLAVVAYVPEAKQSELSGEEWLKTVLANFGGEVISSEAAISTGSVKTNADKGVFPLKIIEPMILEANNFLRKKGLFPEDNGDDDDDYIFGDDDFPS